MFDRTQSMLPKTATDLARALDILEERLFLLPVAMISKDPMTVSEVLLDHLAWENSVDVWDEGWPVDVKRRVVQLSADVHQFKGTPYAIKRALSAFGVGIELIEWWHVDGSGVPGTFRVRVIFPERQELLTLGSSSAVITAIRSSLSRVAPVSRGWSLGVEFNTQTTVQAGCHSRIGGVVRTRTLRHENQLERATSTVTAVSRTGGVHHTKGLAA